MALLPHWFGGQSHERCGGVEPVGKLLYVPANPRGERAVLVVVIHGRQMPPGIVPAGKLYNAGFKIDAEPFPPKKKQAKAGRCMCCAKAWPQSGRSEK